MPALRGAFKGRGKCAIKVVVLPRHEEMLRLTLREPVVLQRFGEIMGPELGLWCSWADDQDRLYIVTR